MIKPVSSNTSFDAVQQKAAAQVEDDAFQKAFTQAQKAEDDKKLKAACQELESVFIYQMMEAMRATVPADSLIGRSQAEDIFQGMLDQQYARIVSQTDSIGLADILYRQLKQSQDTTKQQQSSDESKTP